MHDLTATLSHVVCQGVQRMRLLDFIPGAPFLTARSLEIPQPARSSAEIAARLLNLRRLSVGAATSTIPPSNPVNESAGRTAVSTDTGAGSR